MDSELLKQVSVFALGGTWLWGFLCVKPLLRCCFVADQSSQWSLACAVATGGLIVSFHLSGFAWLISGLGLVTPAVIAIIFPLVMYAIYRLMRRMAGPVEQGFSTGEQLGLQTRGAGMDPVRSCWQWAPVFILAGTYAVFLIDAATRYPTGYDGLHYHLPMAVRWIQERTLDVVPTDIHQNFPNNGMLLPYLLLCCGLHRLTSLAMFPQGILLVLLVYAIAGQLGIGRLGRLIATCLVMSIPLVIFQTFSSYIDLFATNAWLASLLALMWASRAERSTHRRCLILVAGLCAGIAIGSKLTYIAVGGVLICVAAALPWISRGRTGRPWIRPVARSVLLFGLAASSCCGFWFVRNLVRTGNPVYPFGVAIAGVEVFEGPDPHGLYPERSLAESVQEWWKYPWIERRAQGYNYGVGSGVGAAYATFVPLAFLGCVISMRGWRTRSTTDRWRIVSCALVCFGVGLFLTLLHQMMRFALPMIVLSAVCAAVLIERIARRRPRCVLGLLSASLIVTGSVAVLKPGKEFLGRLRDGVWTHNDFYETPRVINDLPLGSTIVNVNAPTKNFALLGDRLTNRVIGPAQWSIVLNHEPPTLETFNELGVDYLFVASGASVDWPVGLKKQIVFDSRVADDRVSGVPCVIYRVFSNSPGFVGQPDEFAHKRPYGLRLY